MKAKTRNKRQSVNAVSLLATCLFLFLAVQFSDGGGLFATKINKITENLDRAVLGLTDDVTYTNYTDNSVYYSDAKFSAAGMAGLYNLTNLFIDAIVPEDILMKGLIYADVYNGISINENLPPASEVLKYYASLVAIVLFLVLCVLLFPLCGLCFCCCRCCGNCGARPKRSDKKRDTCKKVIQASFLIMCGTGLLFCIVCAFGSNQQLQEGLEGFPTHMNTSIKDTKTFMDSTNGQVRHLLKNNYDEFTDAFKRVMSNGSEIAMEQLLSYANATNVSEIYNFANRLNDTQVMLYSLKDGTNKLRVYASQLNDAIRKVKRDLTETLQKCSPIPSCNEIKSKIDALQTSIDFNRVPDVSSTIESFGLLNISEIQQNVAKGQTALEKIQDKINSSLSSALNEAEIQINNGAAVIDDNLKQVTDTIDQVKTQIDSTATPVISTTRRYVNEYGKYRYYVGLTISCVLLLVTVCIIFGLICGICGKRPDGYSDNCCNKGAGGQFLLCGVLIMFFFGFIMSIITLVSLLLGVVSEKVICDPLRNPNTTKYTVIELIDNFNLDIGVDVKPSTLLTNCYQNKSIYQTFNLESKFNISKIKEQFDITDELNKLDFDTSITGNITLIDDDTLEALKKFTPDIDVDKFNDELMKNFTNYSLDELSTNLKNIIVQLDDQIYVDVKNSLQLSLLHIDTYNDRLVIPMKELCNNLLENATSLNDQLRMGYGSFHEAIDALEKDIRDAETALQDGTKLTQTAQYFKNITLSITNGYVQRVSDYIQTEIGQCGPLSLVINATLTATCERVLLPWNGFWLSLFWTIILYVITIIISVKLANLYQKQKTYDQYVETEYLYDAYADRGDNIPLNSRGGKRGKKKGKKTKRYDERPNVGRDGPRDYPAASHPPDGRYADMAPKHWEDFPNGGPPHYQRAPTEYERPPPYYYPGSGGEQ